METLITKTTRNSDKQRAVTSVRMIGNKYRLGKSSWNKGLHVSGMSGKKHSASTRNKMSVSMSGVEHINAKGKKHHNWKGGVSFDQTHVSLVKNARNRDKAKSSGKHTGAQWTELKILYNNKCVCCGISEKVKKLTKDHIVPFSLGGSDNIENIQPLCNACNVKKSSKIIDYRINYKTT